MCSRRILVANDTNSGTGSGFFISDDGYIATANHVIDGQKTIKVVMSNGEMYDAKVIDGNDYTDIVSEAYNTMKLMVSE